MLLLELELEITELLELDTAVLLELLELKTAMLSPVLLLLLELLLLLLLYTNGITSVNRRCINCSDGQSLANVMLAIKPQNWSLGETGHADPLGRVHPFLQ